MSASLDVLYLNSSFEIAIFLNDIVLNKVQDVVLQSFVLVILWNFYIILKS